MASQTNIRQLKYIGLIGAQSAGKDYVGHWLQQHIERKTEVVKFATKLTELTAALLGVDDLSLFQDRAWKELEQFVWQCCIKTVNKKARIISAREAQQYIGTDICRRLLGADVWVRALAASCQDPDTLYIVTDVRFQNEMDFIRANNGVIVYIENLQAAQKQHRRENGLGHESEQLMWAMHYGDIKPDYVLHNNDFSSMVELEKLQQWLPKEV